MNFLYWRKNSAKVVPEYNPIVIGGETVPIVITMISNTIIPVREPIRFYMPSSSWPHTDGEQLLVSNKAVQTTAVLANTTPIANAEVC